MVPLVSVPVSKMPENTIEKRMMLGVRLIEVGHVRVVSCGGVSKAASLEVVLGLARPRRSKFAWTAPVEYLFTSRFG